MKQIGYIIICAVLLGCGATESSPEAIAAQNRNLTQFESQLEQEGLAIEFDWAQPASGGQINLLTTSNSLDIKGDTITAYLPYYGVRRMANFGDDGGIKFTSIAEEKVIVRNEKKGALEVTFNVSSEREDYNFALQLFGNGKCLLNVTSSKRDFIQYQGAVVKK